jgi:hypothetical protein
MHDNATNNNRLVAPVTGVYAITASVEWQGNATGIRSLGIRPNNGDVLALDDRVGATGGGGQSIDTIARLNAGDFVDVVAAQTSGGPLDIANIDPRSPEFSMVWIAPG